MTNLSDVLPLLDRGDAPNRKYPDGKGEYWALCPYHPDSHSGSFSVSERGFRCFSCGKDGSLSTLLERLIGYSSEEYKKAAKQAAKKKPTKPPPDVPPVNLEQYSEAKKLPVSFLASLGMRTGMLWGKEVVEIPYMGVGGEVLRVRYRLSMSGPGHERFRWAKGEGTYPYGLWRLPPLGRPLVIVEGESDAQTLWYHNIAALGVPGATSWKTQWFDYVEGYRIYFWQEPDSAGAEFAERLASLNPRVISSDKWKDVSECYVKSGKLPKSIMLLQAIDKWKQVRDGSCVLRKKA